MLGGLHIEMATWKTLGDWLKDSGWSGLLQKLNITTSGRVDALRAASHLSRTCHAHQVTGTSLYTPQQKAYTHFVTNLLQGHAAKSFDDWKKCMASQNLQFQYWERTLQFELTVLLFVKAIRLGKFELYVEALAKLVVWFFALDHTHYACWLSVNLRDMMTLTDAHPSVYTEFTVGNFSFYKTQHAFSAIATDQSHEQNNWSVKGDGEAVGLTENPAALRRWMVAG